MSTPAAVRVWESHWTLYRAIWKSNMAGAFVQPLLYLLGMGVGVGALVNRNTGSSDLLGGLTYFEFLAPAMLATTAMMIGTQESLWPVMGGFKWQRTFLAQAASPLTPGEITSGLLLWQLTRALIAVGGVAAVLVLFDGTRSWGLVAAVPFAALTAGAFAAPLTAWAATRDRESSFPSIMRFGIMPLFLFGGAFYPIGELPGWMQPIARVTPLWHGVELCRNVVHGTLGWTDAAGHVALLSAYVVAGTVLARLAFTRRLAE